MTRARHPGPVSLAGLRWLAAVGPAPLEAWATAMGWAPSTAKSHAARLAREGWTEACSMTRGQGSLYFATRTGTEMARLDATPVVRTPAPMTWAHHEACAWTAAWLTVRGRRVVGGRQLLADDRWRGEVHWLEHGGVRRRGHRPDLAAGLRAGGPLLPIEVELATKSSARLRAILGLYSGWITSGKTTAVIYICQSELVAEHIRAQGARVGVAAARKTLRVEMLDRIRDAARTSRGEASAT